MFTYVWLSVFLFSSLSLGLSSSVFFLSVFPPSVSFSLFSGFPNGAAKLLFPSHYLICASPLSCKSTRYSSLFSINSTAVKLQLPITKHCWGRREKYRQRQGERKREEREGQRHGEREIWSRETTRRREWQLQSEEEEETKGDRKWRHENE